MNLEINSQKNSSRILKNLSDFYFYQENGELDSFTKLMDCLNIHLYFILKNKINNLVNPYEVFLRDTNFFVSCNNEDDFYDIDFLDNSINDDIFQLEYHKGKGQQTFTEVEKLLDEGEMVIIYTDTRKVPFFNNNQEGDGNQGEEGVALGHVFMLVHHQENKLYYIEAPWNLNIKNFIPYNKNKSIGTINKDDLSDAFNSFLTYITVKTDIKGYEHRLERVKKIFHKIPQNYYQSANIKNELRFFYGQDAINILIELCNLGKINLKDQSKSFPFSLFNLLDWRIINIIRRRIILKETIKNCYYSNKEMNQVASDLDLIIKSWQTFLTVIRKMNIKKQYVLNSSMKDYLNPIGGLEQKLIYDIEKLGNII